MTPDLLGIVVPSQGTASNTFGIRNSPALIGAIQYHRVAPVEFGVTGSITTVRTSNALTLTIGVF